MRSFIQFLAVACALVSLSSYGASESWPLTRSEQDELLNRSKSFAGYKPERQESVRREMVSAFHFMASVAAYEAYWKEIYDTFDGGAPEPERRAVLQKAEAAASKAARAEIERLKNLKSPSGKPLPGAAISFRALPANTATETFHEYDRFLDDEGKINLKNRFFGADTRLLEKDRPLADALSYLTSYVRGTPEERKKAAAEARKRAAKFTDSMPVRAYYGGGSPYQSSYNHTCGVPSAQVGALRPESNGMR
jgi:hypothetical protein